ncbi:MAG TPA: response regulator [Polyangiaceae bacterium]|nr:response regulator [Polyangiaceae bacterium]
MGAILIVEDDDDIRELIAEVLRREGYDVLEAEHGARALEILAEQRTPPCLILLDLMMPIMSGPELIKVLRETDRLASLPVVVVSAGGRPEDAPEARKFVRKPPNLGLLQTLAEEFCGRPPAADARAEAKLSVSPARPAQAGRGRGESVGRPGPARPGERGRGEPIGGPGLGRPGFSLGGPGRAGPSWARPLADALPTPPARWARRGPEGPRRGRALTHG